MEIADVKNIINNIKQTLENFWDKLNITIVDIIEFVSCFGIGFLLGLILKRYLKYFILLTIFSILLIVFLKYLNVICIDCEQIKVILGFSQTSTCDEMIQKILILIKQNSIAVVCTVLGCLLGFQVG